MNKIVINGKEIQCNGKNVSIINNKIYVDGKVITEDIISNTEIYIYGNIENLECEGSVHCDDVHGNIKAGGSVNCDNVGGDINCGGSVNCDKVKGSIVAGGCIKSNRERRYV